MTRLSVMGKNLSAFHRLTRHKYPLIDWVRSSLEATHRVTRYIHPDQPSTRFCAAGPWKKAAVVLSESYRLVPVDGQPCDSDPFTVVERDGRYYGPAGCCDMRVSTRWRSGPW